MVSILSLSISILVGISSRITPSPKRNFIHYHDAFHKLSSPYYIIVGIPQTYSVHDRLYHY